MSKDELNPQKIMSTLQQWKEQKAMIKGRTDQMLNDADSAWAQQQANLFQTILGENQRLKGQLDEALKQIPKPKEAPKHEMPDPQPEIPPIKDKKKKS